jgi:hypothetical protein
VELSSIRLIDIDIDNLAFEIEIWRLEINI